MFLQYNASGKKYVLRWRSFASFIMSIFGNILSNSPITCSKKSTSTSAASWRMENSKCAEKIYSEFIPWPIFEQIFWFMDKLNEFLFKKSIAFFSEVIFFHFSYEPDTLFSSPHSRWLLTKICYAMASFYRISVGMVCSGLAAILRPHHNVRKVI